MMLHQVHLRYFPNGDSLVSSNKRKEHYSSMHNIDSYARMAFFSFTSIRTHRAVACGIKYVSSALNEISSFVSVSHSNEVSSNHKLVSQSHSSELKNKMHPFNKSITQCFILSSGSEFCSSKSLPVAVFVPRKKVI